MEICLPVKFVYLHLRSDFPKIIVFLSIKLSGSVLREYSLSKSPTFPNSNSMWNIFQALYHEPLARVIAQALPVFDIKADLHFTFTFYMIDAFKFRV